MGERSVLVRIRAEIGDFKKQMTEASKVTEQVGKATQETAAKSKTALGQMVQSASRHEEAWTRSGTALLGFGAAVAVGVGMAIKSYAEFDKAMSEVRAATHASSGDMEQLRAAAITAGADTSYSAREAADAISELSKAGVATKDILSGGLAGSLSLAAAGGLAVADAAELAATALVQFKLSGSQVPHVSDLLAAGAGKAQGSVEDLGAALNQSGLIAASTGLTIEETTGGLAAFASAGLLGSDAGTSFKTMLQSLTPNSKEAASEMAKLGINAYDSQGKFVGLSKFAGILQDSMKGLTDEQRNASMKIIFGSDAVRAANVLYEQGAKGITDWTSAVNEAGYAATTAAIKQDNLAGDIEKLGGSLDSVFLKSGSGANDVLRGLVRTAESFVDAVGNIPGPVLQAGVGLAAVAGGAALVGGAFLTTFPKIIETKKAFSELAESSPKLAGGLGKVAKAAGIAGTALVALQVAGTIGKSMFGKQANSAEDFAQSLLTLGKGTQELDALFRDGGLGSQINGVGDALARMSQKDGFDDLGIWLGDLMNSGSKLNTMRDNINGLDSSLANLAKNGAGQKAGDSFRILAEEADKSAKAQGRMGMSTDEVLKLLPQYSDSLKAQANALGVKLSQEELHDMALGKIPARLAAVQASSEGQAKAAEYQAKMTEEAAKHLEDLGINAEGAVVNVSNFTTALINAGLLTLSSRDAVAKFEEGIDSLEGKIKNIMATEQAHGGVLNQQRTDLDLTSEAGRAANEVLQDMTTRGLQAAEAMAKNGAAQPEVQNQLNRTYDAMLSTVRGFGLGKDEAEALTRSILHIPPGVSVESWMSSEAKRMAEQTTGALNQIDGRVVTVTTVERTIKRIEHQVVGGGSADDPSMTAFDPGTFSRRDGGLIKFNQGGEVRRFAAAGYVRGPGTGTSDSINARLSNGEYVIRASKVAQYGVKTFDAYNNGYAPLSKSVAGGYGQTQTFGGYNGTAAGSAATEGDITVYVTNPWTGEQVRGVVTEVARTEAASAVKAADGQARYMRTGRG